MYFYNSNYLLTCANVMLNYGVMQLYCLLLYSLSTMRNVCRLNFDNKFYSFFPSTKIKQNPKYTNITLTAICRMREIPLSPCSYGIECSGYQRRVSVSVITVGVRGPRDTPDNTAEILSSHGGSGELGVFNNSVTSPGHC